MINIHFWQAGKFKALHYGLDEFVVVGETDSYAWIAVRKGDGFVYAASDDGSPGLGFMNSSLQALLACLTMYHREFIDHLEDDVTEHNEDGTGTPISRARAKRIRERLLQLDPAVLDQTLNRDTVDVTIWEFVAEEVEYGIL